MDLTEVENIKKKGQEYKERYKKKHHNDQYNQDRVMTQLETDILESEVKCAMGRIIMNKASGGDRIPVELFQVLKDDVAQVLQTVCQLIWRPQ